MNAGLQLWSLNDCFDNDIKKKIAYAAECGYYGVEFAGFGGLNASEMKEVLDANSIKALGSHSAYDIFKNSLEEELSYLKEIGAKYMIIPWAEYKDGMDSVKEVADVLNNAAKKAKEYGITVGYHNHAQEFEKVDGKYILDLLMELTDDDVIFEVDVFWVTYAGVNPYEYVASKGKKVELIHLKQIGEEKKNVVLPDGEIDFAKIRESAKYAKEFIVEQEGDVDKVEACKINGDFVANM